MFKKLLVGTLIISLVLSLSTTIALAKRTITYWDSNVATGDPYVDNYERFIVQFPDIKVEREFVPADSVGEKVMIAIAGDATPDVLLDYIGRIAAYYYQDALELLNETLSQEDLDDFLPSLLEQFTLDGTLTAFPCPFGCRLWGVDKILVEKAGAVHLLPQGLDREWSFKDFMEVAEAAKGLGVYPFCFFTGATGGDYFEVMYHQIFGAKLYENGDHTKTTWNSEAGVRALEWIVQMIHEGYAPPGAAGFTCGDMVNMKAAGKILVGNYFTPTQCQEHFDSGVIGYVKNDWQVEVPHIDGIPAPPLYNGPSGFCLFRSVKDKDAALTFMRFMVNKESVENICLNTTTWNPISSRLSIEATPESRVTQYMVNKNGIGDLGLCSPHYREVRVLMASELQAAFMGKKSPREALDDFAQAVSELWE